MSKSQEKIGITLVLLSASIHGLSPLIISKESHNIPPVTFAAITTIIGAFFCFLIVLKQKKLHELKIKKAYPSLLLVGLLIVIIPHILFFIGSSKTSGINTSLLGLSEMIFLLIFTPFIGEKNTPEKVLSALAILIGGIFILYQGKLTINTGDLLIIASTACYPIGNFYAKKAFNMVSSSTVLFVRFLLGAIAIPPIAFFLEPQANIQNIITNHWITIFFTGIIFLGIGKTLWYEGFKRLDMSKGISLILTAPLFSVFFLVTIFHENISIQQWMGIAIMTIGIYFSAKRKSVDMDKTKYGII
ncbi:DMT family transporter [Candidatus Peregrinibacteria bacterium]|nr:DMT family transporter [Candidatus Peregrinibacteria bacterium]